MAISVITNRNVFLGDGSTTVFPYTFKCLVNSDMNVKLISPSDPLGNVTVTNLVLGTDYTLTGIGSPNGGGNINLLTLIPQLGYTLIAFRLRPLTQAVSIRNETEFYQATVEAALDQLVMIDQQQQEQISRAVKFSANFTGNFNPELPNPSPAQGGYTLMLDPTGTKLVWGFVSGTAGAGGGVPGGGALGAVLVKKSPADGDTIWKTFGYSGWSTLLNKFLTSINLDDTLTQLLGLAYTAPTISVSLASAGTYENGVTVPIGNFIANVVRHTDPIASITYQANGTTIAGHTSGAAFPNGGQDSLAFPGNATANLTLNAIVADTGVSNPVPPNPNPSTAQASAKIVFVYPYYAGCGAQGLTPAQVATLTKSVIQYTQALKTVFTATAGQSLYFAYPAAYSDLISVLDSNGLETISDWNKTTANITGLDGTSQSYKIYTFANPVSAGSYTYTLKGS